MELKDKILSVAKTFMFEYGVKRVSIDDICNEMRISKKTFYTVFETKEELIKNILQEIETNKDSKHTIDENTNVIDLLCSKTKFFKQNIKEKYLLIHYDLEKYYPEILSKHLKNTREKSLNQLQIFLKKGIEQGFFREDMNIVLTSCMINDIFTYSLNYYKEKRATLSVLVDFLTDTIIRIVCNDKGMEYYLKIKN